MKNVKFIEGVLLAIRGKQKEDRLAIGSAITEAQRHFGNPHSHRGVGIRKVSKRYYELRVGLHCRLLFTNEPAFLRFVAEGSHDQIKRFLKHHP